MEPLVICESVSAPAWSETLCMYGSYLHGSREIPPPALEMIQGPRCESGRSTTAMYGSGKSDRLIVAEKRLNKHCGAPWYAESVEPSGLTKGNFVSAKQVPDTVPEGSIWTTLNGHEARNRGHSQETAPTSNPETCKVRGTDTAGC